MRTGAKKSVITGGNDRFRRLEEIFAEAVAVPADERREFVLSRCGADAWLLTEVEAMLDSADAARGFLDRSAFEIGASVIAKEGLEVPKSIGGYSITKEIGRGGMGAVYLAERPEFKQQVALKVIKRGMDTDEILRRFRQEREILASLTHPNIARLLDGGTTDDGRPYFVMEYIDGVSITAYCDQNKLPIDARLALFRKVCSAISYAHANLVIHRDIKPSNIIIDATGEPKLLDFGIAKVLCPERFDAGVETTITGMQMLTPEYAAPEQILGQRVTTASDVYSLGVLLFELLSGHRPFSLKHRPASEVADIVARHEPTAPSTAAVTVGEASDEPTDDRLTPKTIADLRNDRPERLRRRLTGDLDNIVLMSLRKEPDRRYGSVDQFSEDVLRHLDGIPVLARPATLVYTASKFIERNRVAAAFAGLALASLIGGIGIAGWQAYRANIERTRAERRFGEIRQLANNLVSGWDRDIPETQITDVVRGRIADISSEYINNLANETTDPELLKELVRANIKVGHDYAYASFQMEKAQARLKDAITLSRRLVAEFPEDLEAKQLLKDSLAAYSESTLEFELEAIDNTRERAELLEQISQAKAGDIDAKRTAAFEIAHYGGVLRSFGRSEEAATQQRKALAVNQEIVGQYEGSTDLKDRLRLVFTLTTMAERYARDLNGPETGVVFARRAAVAADAALADAPDDGGAVINKESSHYTLGLISRALGDLDSSDRALTTVVETARSANAANVSSYSVRKEYDSLVDLAVNQWMRGDRNRAAKYLDEAIEARRRFTSLPTQLDSASSHSGNVYFFLEAANVFRRIGMEQRAEELYRQAVAEMDHYSEMSKPNKSVLMTKSDLLLALGDQLAGVTMCTQNPGDYLDVGRFDRYCPPQDETIRASANSRLKEATDLYAKSAELTDSLINSGAVADHVIRNSRAAATRLAAIRQR